VILLDANVLVYATITGVPQHAPMRAWLEERLSEGTRVAMPWPSLLAFVRLVSNPKVFQRTLPIEQAWERVLLWLSIDTVWVPAPTDVHPRILGGLLAHAGNRSDLVPDAHLAALAIEHGLALCSTDGDFARFPGLRWIDPLRRPNP